MELDRDQLQLQFDSAQELDAFHRELTGLLREVTLNVSSKTTNAQEARALAQEVLRQFELVTRILNELRAR